MPDLSDTRPAGLKRSALLVGDLLDRLRKSPGDPIILGGYSQGAMVAAEVAFESDERLAGLVLLSGTFVDELRWRERLSRRRGLPVFISHGRDDRTLPFAVAERLRDTLVAAGAEVTWCPFDGGHEVPAVVVAELNDFIKRLTLTIA
jgi:phospholipase/carboxylesterase